MNPDLIRELQLERSQLLDLLMEARRIIARQAGIMGCAKAYAQSECLMFWSETAEGTLNGAQAFLDAGLFGDKVKEEAK